jgi:putative Holliday junction resolvase
MRILAVDPGDVRIGLALSDPLRIIAKPLDVILHKAREEDARNIIAVALDQDASTILVGVPYDDESEIGAQARKSLRLVAVLEKMSDLEILTWDESGSSQAAAELSRKTDDQIDALAAAVILQDFLDAEAK